MLRWGLYRAVRGTLQDGCERRGCMCKRSLTHTGAPRVHGPSPRTYPRPRPHTRSQLPGCPHPAVLLQAGQESVLGSSVGRRRRSPIVRGEKKKKTEKSLRAPPLRCTRQGEPQGCSRRLAANGRAPCPRPESALGWRAGKQSSNETPQSLIKGLTAQTRSPSELIFW